MANATLTAVTPVGTFTRTTASPYKFITVWTSPRAIREVSSIKARGGILDGVHGRWNKDNCYGTTWHNSHPGTPKSYKWDEAATLVGVFEVNAV